jgi:hypothetical protein
MTLSPSVILTVFVLLVAYWVRLTCRLTVPVVSSQWGSAVGTCALAGIASATRAAPATALAASALLARDGVRAMKFLQDCCDPKRLRLALVTWQGVTNRR